MDNQRFQAVLEKYSPQIPPETREKLGFYRSLVLEANQEQNLTRLTSPEDFYDGHVFDVETLLGHIDLGFPALDLGSGSGVPGLLAGILRPDRWILCESEGKKAEFLARATEKLELASQITVFSGRAEEFLKRQPVSSVVCRAVGPAERIYGWIGKCSTWNSLVLFKGPKWDEEWATQSKRPWAKKLQLAERYDYETPIKKARHVLVRFERVPRGTLGTPLANAQH